MRAADLMWSAKTAAGHQKRSLSEKYKPITSNGKRQTGSQVDPPAETIDNLQLVIGSLFTIILVGFSDKSPDFCGKWQ